MMDISSLLSSLSDEDIDKLKKTAQDFFGEKISSEKTDKPLNQNKFDIDPAMLSGVAKLSVLMNENDDRCVFIQSMKPLLSEARRKKADDAIMLLRLMKMINTLQETN